VIHTLAVVLSPIAVAFLIVLDVRHRRALRRLAQLARTDGLTGLPNRRAWDEALKREMARSERTGAPLSVALIDVDRFKRFNDLHGHAAGDLLLKTFAARAERRLRLTDVLARYGGEEFAVVLPSCPMGLAREIVDRLRSAIPDDQTCSAGLTAWDGEQSADDLMHAADLALYSAKRTGRDRTTMAAEAERTSGNGVARA
jgi:diguanylate cyclase (GGDEF)-like protein